MNEIKVSVILPVYNVEKYLNQCLESLVSQTLEDIEIVAVNDGSTDSSKEILERFSEKYPDKIRFVTTQNRGLSAARNYGISLAKGKFISFVDSDDYIDKRFLETLYQAAEDNDCEAAVCGYQRVYEDGSPSKPIPLKVSAPYNRSMREDFELLRLAPYAWNKIFSRELILKSGVLFPEGMKYEDIATIYPWLLEAKKVSLSEDVLYNYRFNRPDSIMNNSIKNCCDMLSTLDICNKYMRKNGLSEKGESLLCELNLKHIYFRFSDFRKIHGCRRKKYEFIKKAFDYLDREFPQWKKNEYFSNTKGGSLKKAIKKSKLFAYLSLIK